MKPTTLFGTLVLLSAWSSVGATEAATYSIQKADNSSSNGLLLHGATKAGRNC